MEMDVLKQFIKPELFVIIPVLYTLGKILKDTTAVKDKFIPAVLGVVATVLSIVYVAATTDIASYQDFLMAIFVAFTQGVLCAGCAVYVNQLFAQSKKGE